ncbi:hypothetical protein DL89DRAFT_75032 [Linderina pennispora]|uniref:Uncharacterized protein n=1 Tax=Linderina pennispora TaxID=61395 RepID=A0A1Y1VYC8_9FUNG|nr:uncharacterized protein DL89DRAFT_75032 [Linderina pennispora]ORX66016.1 hypothetical protein DL89DRAFT_75032 [Linderina pennispora]
MALHASLPLTVNTIPSKRSSKNETPEAIIGKLDTVLPSRTCTASSIAAVDDCSAIAERHDICRVLPSLTVLARYTSGCWMCATADLVHIHQLFAFGSVFCVQGNVVRIPLRNVAQCFRRPTQCLINKTANGMESLLGTLAEHTSQPLRQAHQYAEEPV